LEPLSTGHFPRPIHDRLLSRTCPAPFDHRQRTQRTGQPIDEKCEAARPKVTVRTWRGHRTPVPLLTRRPPHQHQAGL